MIQDKLRPNYLVLFNGGSVSTPKVIKQLQKNKKKKGMKQNEVDKTRTQGEKHGDNY